MGSGSSPPGEAVAGSLGLGDLTWKKGGLHFPHCNRFQGEGLGWAGAHLERIGGSDPSCLPSSAQRGLSDLEQGPGKGGRKKSGCEPHLVRHSLGGVGGISGPSAPPHWPYLPLLVLWRGADQEMRLGAPFKAREALPGPSVGSQREEWGRDHPPPNPEPSQQRPHHRVWGHSRGQGAARLGVGFVWSCVCVWVRGHWKPRPKGTAPHAGLGAPQRLVCCVVWQRGRRWVVVVQGRGGLGEGAGAVGAERSCPVPEGKSLLGQGAGGTSRSLLLLGGLLRDALFFLLLLQGRRQAGRSAVPGLPPAPDWWCWGVGAQARRAPTPPWVPWLSRRGMSQG